MRTFRLEILEKEKIIYNREIQFLKLPGEEGEVGILPEHAGIILTLQSGEIKIKEENQKVKIFQISRGVFKFLHNRGICLLY